MLIKPIEGVGKKHERALYFADILEFARKWGCSCFKHFILASSLMLNVDFEPDFIIQNMILID